jgi:hypothetical protein
MNTKISLALFALAMSAVPASAQISTTDRVRDRVLGGDRAGTQTRTGGTVGDVILGRSDDQRASARVPRGHLPPRGMCRVWIDGVPPGRQPAPTSCANAQRDRVHYGANARVIYGDDESHPGRGNGRYKNRDGRTETGVFSRTGTASETAAAKRKVNAAQQKQQKPSAQKTPSKGKKN